MRLAVLVVIALATTRAHAGGTVALLPLDADKALELYGQPVATEISRSLKEGGIDVAVVTRKMSVPDSARLVIDGTISGKTDAVKLAIRIRDPKAGTVLETLLASGSTIEAAETDLAGRILPAVKSHLAALDRPKDTPKVLTPPAPPAPAPDRPLAIVIGGADPLKSALVYSLTAAAHEHHRDPKPIDVTLLARSDSGIGLDIRSYDVELAPVPMARAHVRLRLVDGGKVVFDRVLVTDTIVGDKGMAPADLAHRVAEEVLAIALPRIKKVTSW